MEIFLSPTAIIIGLISLIWYSVVFFSLLGITRTLKEIKESIRFLVEIHRQKYAQNTAPDAAASNDSEKQKSTLTEEQRSALIDELGIF